MKRGFTLIELLAVIVILAIIAIIVTPMITGTINSARSSSLKTSAQSIANAAEQYCTRIQTSGATFNKTSYAINEGNAERIGFSYNQDLYGTLVIDSNCKVAIMTTNGIYQTTKTFDEDDVTTIKKTDDFDTKSVELAEATASTCFETYEDTTMFAITGYDTRCGTDVIIPNKIDGKVVTVIGNNAFASKGLTSVNFYNMTGLKSIANYSFYNNKLTKVDLSYLTTLTEIDNYSFNKNSISELDLNNMSNLTLLGNYTFDTNQIKFLSLTDLPLLKTIGSNTFSVNKIETLTINNLPKLESIADYTFWNNSINSLTLTNLPSLKSIGQGAFYRLSPYCSPKYTFGSTPLLTSIYEDAFKSNNYCSDKADPTVTYQDDNVASLKTIVFK